MKKIFSIITALLFVTSVFAFSGGSRTKKASELYLPIGKNMQISLADLSVIKEKDFEKLTGKHLNFFQRLEFKASQKKLRNSIDTDGTVNNKMLSKVMDDEDHSTGFHIGGFLLGFFLGLLGVLIAYLIGGDNRHNRVKWAWIAVGILVAIVLIGVVL